MVFEKLIEKSENDIKQYILKEFENIDEIVVLNRKSEQFDGFLINYEALGNKIGELAQKTINIINYTDILLSKIKKNEEYDKYLNEYNSFKNNITIEVADLITSYSVVLFENDINSASTSNHKVQLLTFLMTELDFSKYIDKTNNYQFSLAKTIQAKIENYNVRGMQGNDGDKKNCYIATLVYGDINHPKVELFRGFRDNTLSKNQLGRTFIKYYYRYSPRLVKVLEPYKNLNEIIRFFLDIIIKTIK